MPTSITIRGHSFPLPDRYTPGHCLTPSEAQALNGVRAENIRNIVLRRTMARSFTLDERGQIIKASDVLRVKAMVEELRASYEFPGEKKGRAQIAVLTKVALEIATDLVETEERRQGVSFDSGVKQSMIGELAESEDVLVEAKRRVEAGRGALEEMMESGGAGAGA